MPADGVYVVDIEVQRKDGVVDGECRENVTLMEKKEPRFESIFLISDDIYGETVYLLARWKCRENGQNLTQIEELVDQLQAWRSTARE